MSDKTPKIYNVPVDTDRMRFVSKQYIEGSEPEILLFNGAQQIDRLKDELVAANAARERAEAERDEIKADAERWNEVLMRVSAHEDEYGIQRFTIRGIADPTVNLMRGSVAEHFTVAIDAALARLGGKGG